MKTESDFWSKVDMSGGVESCWPWIPAIRLGGYGNANFEGKQEPAHRAAYRFSSGAIPAGLFVCHRCDYKPCCNPKHLFLGTPLENMQDKVKKGRCSRGESHAKSMKEHTDSIRGNNHWTHKKPEFLNRGENVNTAKLTEDLVRSLRRERSEKKTFVRILAKRHGMSVTCMHRVLSRKTWKHVI